MHAMERGVKPYSQRAKQVIWLGIAVVDLLMLWAIVATAWKVL